MGRRPNARATDRRPIKSTIHKADKNKKCVDLMGRQPNACRVPFGRRFNVSLGQQQFNVSNKTISVYATHVSLTIF